MQITTINDSSFSLKKLFTFKNIFIVVLIAVIVFLATCHRPTPDISVVQTVPQQQGTVKHDTIFAKANYDSVNKIITTLSDTADYWHHAFNVSSNEILALEQGMTDYIATAWPDTCKKYQQQVLLKLNGLIAANGKQAQDCNNTISAKDSIIKKKDVLIGQDKTAYNKLLSDLDTAFAQQVKLTADIKKLKPKGELYTGAMIMTNYLTPLKVTLGMSIGYRFKNSTQVEIGGTLRRDIFISYKKKIF